MVPSSVSFWTYIVWIAMLCAFLNAPSAIASPETATPTESPSFSPTDSPTDSPTFSPSRTPTRSPTTVNSVVLFNGGATVTNGQLGNRASSTLTCLASPHYPTLCDANPSSVRMIVSYNSSDEVVLLFGYGGYLVRTYDSVTGLTRNTVPSNPWVVWTELFTSAWTLSLPVSNLWWFGTEASGGTVSVGGNCNEWTSSISSDVGTLGSATSLTGGAYPCNAAANAICGCLAVVPLTESPTFAPTVPTLAPTVSPTASPVVCPGSPTLPVCESEYVVTLGEPIPNAEGPFVPVIWYGGTTLMNGTNLANGTMMLLSYSHYACHYPPLENGEIVMMLILNMVQKDLFEMMVCKNAGFHYDVLSAISMFNVTGDVFSMMGNWSAPYLEITYVMEIPEITIGFENGAPFVIALGYSPSPEILTLSYATFGLSTPPMVQYFATSCAELRLYTAPNLVTTQTDSILAGGVVNFLFTTLPNVMEIDFRSFTGIGNVGGGTRTIVMNLLPNLERIRFESWIHAGDVDQIAIDTNSSRFTNSFGAACGTDAQVGHDAFLELLRNCSAAPGVPDHDYRYACVAPILERCVDYSTWNASCWIAEFEWSDFTIRFWNGDEEPLANLSTVDCVLDANHFINLTNSLILLDLVITSSLKGLERIRAENLYVEDSTLPSETDVSDLTVLNSTTFRNVSGIETLRIDLTVSYYDVRGCEDLSNFTISPGSVPNTMFTFENNPKLTTAFPACEGVMNTTQFFANCFSGGGGTFAPTSIPTMLPTASPSTLSPTTGSPTYSPTLPPVFYPTFPPTPPFECDPPSVSPTCSYANVTANFEDVNLFGTYPETYFVAPSAIFQNDTSFSSQSPVLIYVSDGKEACNVPVSSFGDDDYALFNVHLYNMSYDEISAWFCKNLLGEWPILNSMVVLDVDGSAFPWFTPALPIPSLAFKWNEELMTLSMNFAPTFEVAILTIHSHGLLEWVVTNTSGGPFGWDVLNFTVTMNQQLRYFNASNYVGTESNAATNVTIVFNANSQLMCVDLRSMTGVMTMLEGGTRRVDFSDLPALQRLHLDSWTYHDVDDVIRFPMNSLRFTNSFPSCPSTLVTGDDVLEAIANCTTPSASAPSHDYLYACIITLNPPCEASAYVYDPKCWIPQHDDVPSFLVSDYTHPNLSLVDCVLDDNYLFTVTGTFTIENSNITESFVGLERVVTHTLSIVASALPTYFIPSEFGHEITQSVSITGCVSGAEIVEIPMNVIHFALTSCDFTTNLTLGEGYAGSTFVFTDNPALETNYPTCVGTLSLSEMLERCFPTGTTLTPTTIPTSSPTIPTSSPTTLSPTPPTLPTNAPTLAPIHAPTNAPFTQSPTNNPTKRPTIHSPTHRPTIPTPDPTQSPTTPHPTLSPTRGPTQSPTPQICTTVIN